MKVMSLLSSLIALAALPLGLARERFEPLWTGPRQAVVWRGLSPRGYIHTQAAAVAAPETPKDLAPRWVGYYKRSGEWWIRVILIDGKSEMLRQGAVTSDGWRLTNIAAQANRPTSITLSKDGVEKTLILSSSPNPVANP